MHVRRRVSAVTGVRLGRRSRKFMDYSKVAATLVRLLAVESPRSRADTLSPHITSKKECQMRAYTHTSDKDLFKIECVRVEVSESDLPGRPK
jgi:formylmethanofuran dehydrogenase subunit E